MKKHIESLIVSFNQKEVGTLTMGAKGKIYFNYSDSWLKEGFNLSPFDLNMTSELQAPADNLFSGLHGVFADSISDGWGLMLTDRALQKKYGWERHTITQLDRLFFMGARSMGGLEYLPADTSEKKSMDFDIEDIFNETQKIISGEKEDIIEALYLTGGSPGGARPKALFSRKGEHFATGYNYIPEGYEGWLVKFFSENDSPSIGKIEKAYADMAQDCGIIMPKTDLINVSIGGKDYSFFAIERFDRQAGQKIHVASLSGLVYASHRIPSVSYKDIFNVTHKLCNHHKQLENITGVMLFNILMNNQDDHSKNFSYRYVEDTIGKKMGNWELTPSYDLVFSHGLGNEHMTDVAGSGNPGINEVLMLTQQFGVKDVEAQIEKIVGVANAWESYAQHYDIPKKEVKNIKTILQSNVERFSMTQKKKLKR